MNRSKELSELRFNAYWNGSHPTGDLYRSAFDIGTAVGLADQAGLQNCSISRQSISLSIPLDFERHIALLVCDWGVL